MRKTSIPIIAIAVFSMVLLIGFDMQEVYADTTIYAPTSNTVRTIGDSGGTCNTSDINFVGEEIASGSVLIGQVFDRMTISLRESDTGSTGNALIGVWSSTTAPTSSNYIRLIGIVDVTTIPAPPSFHAFTFDLTPYNITVNTMIGVFYTCTSAFHNIEVRSSTTNQFDGSNSRETSHSVAGGFADNVNADTGFTLIDKSDTIGGAFCEQPENVNKLICRTGGTGTFGSAGAFIVGQAPTNTTDGTGLQGIGCGIGLVDCVADSNPQTNGLGILIFIGSIFVMVGMFFRSLGASETMKIPTFVWVILIIALSAFFTLTGIIDPVFLILSVIALIALASPKIVGMFKGGSSFGSGSTE